jgi:hypothetical protein
MRDRAVLKELRELERIPNLVLTEHRRPEPLWTPGGKRLLVPKLVGYSVNHNLRTNAGADWQAAQMSGAATDARANWIGITDDNAQTLNTAQTTLTSEETTNGLARASGTFSHAGGGATSYTVKKDPFTFTAAGPITIYRSALFTASSGGTMVFIAAFGSSATLILNDQLTVTWTINI